jgi:putative transposase
MKEMKMNRHKPDKVAESERETEIALFRYGLIAPLLFAAPESGPLEATLRQIASKSYQIPYSGRRRVSVSTLRRYLALYQEGGFDALRPRPRADKGSVKAFPPEVLEAAIALRQQQPARTTPMLVELLQRDPNLKLDQPINAHTLTTQLRQRGHSRRQLGQATRTYRRFERDHSNSLWQGDAMVGPWLPDPNVPGKKRRAHLFCFLDDHSRLVPHAEFFWDEALPRLERVLKVALLRRGVPQAIYVDNGQVYSANQFAAACATLAIERIQTAPYSPESKGKQERFFETVRLQFMPEVEVSEITTLAELNESFWAWLACIYHRHKNRETGQTPLARFQAGLDQGSQRRCANSANGFSLARETQGTQGCHHFFARQYLPGRRSPGRPHPGIALRPLRPLPTGPLPGWSPSGAGRRCHSGSPAPPGRATTGH